MAGKGKRGKRTKFTTARCNLIVESLRQGNFAMTAFKLAGVEKTAYYNWLQRGEEELEAGKEDGRYAQFLQRVRIAEADAEADGVATLKEAGVDGFRETKTEITDGPDGRTTKTTTITKKDWRAAAYLLERRQAARWGARQRIQHEGEIQIQQSITLHDGPAPEPEEPEA